MTIGLKDRILELLGRDASLTNRTELWDVVLAQVTDPIVGAGFMSFWTGARMQAIWDGMGRAGINQAHSGYIEQYMNLGFVGVGFISVLMVSSLWKIWRPPSTVPAASFACAWWWPRFSTTTPRRRSTASTTCGCFCWSRR